MSKLAQITVLSLFLLMSLGCSKDNDQQPSTKRPIEGLWIGTYLVNGNPGVGEQYYSLVIKPNGKLINDTKSSGNQTENICLGSWSLNGTTFTATYEVVYGESSNIGVNQSVTGTWDESGKLTGTWQNLAPDNTNGTFTLTRVN